MEITFTVAATACAAVVMFWALFTADGFDDSKGGGGGVFLLMIDKTAILLLNFEIDPMPNGPPFFEPK
tara:strand:- start:98 stop:301 length:204 start_codon:yes stop_codon:yes gene_type:complete